MNLRISWLTLLLLSLALTISSCQTIGQLNSSQKSVLVSQSAHIKEDIKKQIAAKKLNTDPIHLKIDTGLLRSDSSAPQIEVQFPKGAKTFKTQSTSETIVYSHTLILGESISEHAFQLDIEDTQSRYVFRLRSDRDLQSQLKINHLSVYPAQLEPGMTFYPPMALKANNPCELKLYSGAANTPVTIEVVKTEPAGKIFRADQAHQATILDNSTLLSQLSAYQGDFVLTPADAPEQLKIVGFSINQGRPLLFESGSLILSFQEPQAGLQFFQEQYGAVLQQEMDGFYKIKLDLNTSPVQNLESLVRYYSTALPQNITNVSFSSLDSMKTFAIVLDVLQKRPDLIQSMEVNLYNPDVPHIPVDAWRGGTSPIIDSSGNQVLSWWLKETKAFDALDYSMGTGVDVAWIDIGYNTNHPEIKRRLLQNALPYNNNHAIAGIFAGPGNVNYTNPRTTENSDGELYHGLYALLTGFAERHNVNDNNVMLPTVGVAPEARVIPYAALLSWEFASAMKAARLAGADIIGFNQAWRKFDGGSALQGFFEFLSVLWTPDAALNGPNFIRTQLELALANNIPVIFAAHNYSENIKDWTPIDLNDSLPIIVVGAVQPRDPNPSPTPSPLPSGASPTPTPAPGNFVLAANFDPDPNKGHVNGKGSSYGEKMIWAPGDWIDVSSSTQYNILLSSNTDPVTRLPLPTHEGIMGTSFANPFVTGVVALMKSRNPDITPSEIKSILLNSKNFSLPIKAHPDMNKDAISQQYLIDVKAAVLNAISDTNNKKSAQSYKGMIVSNGSSPKELHFNRSIVKASGVTIADTEKYLSIPFQMVSDHVWSTILATDKFVDVIGWSNIRAGQHTFTSSQLEVLDANPVTLKPEIQIISFSPSTPGSTAGFKMTLTGKDLFAYTRNVPESKLQIIFKDIDLSKPEIRIDYTDVSPLPAQASGTDFIQNYVGLDHVFNAKNDGTSFELKIPGGMVPPARYKIFFSSQVSNQRSLTVASDFGVASVGSGSAQEIVDDSTPNPLPPRAYVWLTRDGREKPVQPGQMIGMGINAAALEQLQITIDGRDIPIREFVQQTESNGYVLFQVPHDLEPGVKDLILSLAGNQFSFEQAIKILAMPNPVEIQQLPTTAGFGLDHTVINGDIFVGIANRRQGNEFRTDSELFQWDGKQFQLLQSIPTVAATDIEFFHINGQSYFASTNEYVGTEGATDIYQWNGQNFSVIQSFSSNRNSIKHFEMNQEHFLIETNSTSENRALYRWNGSAFQAFQTLSSVGLTEHVDHFQIGSDHYLAFAVTTHSTSNPNTNAKIFKWNGTRFYDYQSIPSVRAQGIEAFEMNGESYLAIANHGPISDGQSDSRIYKWDGSRFNQIQSVATQFGHSWKHFHSDGVDYLALSEGGSPARFFYWDGTQFVHFRTLGFNGFWEFEYIETGLQRLLVGSYYGGGSFSDPSRVYEFR